MDFADDFVVDDPLIFGYFIEGEFLQISSGLEFMLGYIFSPNLVCLNYLEMISPSLVCLEYSGIVRILLSC